MTQRFRTDLAASIRQRLFNLAKARGEDLDLLLKRYTIERLLYRIGRSRHADSFVLKGAMLFELWMERGHRTTKDLDLLGFGDAEIPRLVALFQELCDVEEADGLAFQRASVQGEEIREGQLYTGIRITLRAMLGNARIPVQVDIGFGDAVVPSPEAADYPSLLDLPRPHIRAYPREATIAEKVHTMGVLGLANSRLKDYYDVWQILRHFEVDPTLLQASMQATFARRGTPLPKELPTGLRPAFAQDPVKQAQWKAFATRIGWPMDADLETVVSDLRERLWPLLRAQEPEE